MYDHIKVGDLVFLKRKNNVYKDKTKNICLVLYKEKLDDDFLLKLLYKNTIKIKFIEEKKPLGTIGSLK